MQISEDFLTGDLIPLLAEVTLKYVLNKAHRSPRLRILAQSEAYQWHGERSACQIFALTCRAGAPILCALGTVGGSLTNNRSHGDSLRRRRTRVAASWWNSGFFLVSLKWILTFLLWSVSWPVDTHVRPDRSLSFLRSDCCFLLRRPKLRLVFTSSYLSGFFVWPYHTSASFIRYT